MFTVEGCASTVRIVRAMTWTLTFIWAVLDPAYKGALIAVNASSTGSNAVCFRMPLIKASGVPRI
jgi:hypothetical protein